LSPVAEFARQVHENAAGDEPRPLAPLYYPSKSEKLHDIKAVVFDVYGTLVNYWKDSFCNSDEKMSALLSAFALTAERFGMTATLRALNANEAAERTLRDFYHGLIGLNHEKSLRKGVAFPEVRVEEIWEVILLMLKRHGYDPLALGLGDIRETARCAAFFYNFHALGRGFYPGVTSALRALREANFHLGIVSNAQFYTPIDLTLFVRDRAGGRLDDYLELFDTELTFFSYEYGVAKPNQLLFRKLYDALYELHILPSQTVYAGNDLSLDIKPASEAGMKTAFFCGDQKTAFVHDLEGEVIPDISFTDWTELPYRLSFYEESEG